ncbi:outer membrane protein assembly factor BamB [Pantoea sp. Mhis]|uniref:outer membrane protein assembly factor BamB n=1 Tax=Pantoea sp. Mhis TaxID=2576759 RepID=UPI00135BD332|nr:outer membrane protein assembly factor BamB [Pantoea sp. Mhis]MXP56595.1 outer membrane protein assembly factor BamB [Pantoea sp. Mhis]
MQLRNYKLLNLILLIFISGCSLLRSEESIEQITPSSNLKNDLSPKTIWVTSIGKGIGDFDSNLHPICHNNIIYAADRFGIVKALSEYDGKEKWSINLAEKNNFFSKSISALLSGGITINGDHLYIGSERGRIYALNIKDGSIAWKTQLSGEILSDPAVSDEMVVLHTSNGMLQGLNQINGKTQWSVDLGMPQLSLRGESAPVVAFDCIIIGDDKGRVNLVGIKQGQLIWQQDISNSMTSTENNYIKDVDVNPIIINGIVYAVTYNGNLAALNLLNGKIIWQKKIDGAKSLIIDSDNIYLTDQYDHIIALNINDGLTLWQQNKLIHRQLTAPVLMHNYLIFGDTKGYLYWFNKYNGKYILSQKFDKNGFHSEALVVDDKIIIQSKNGKLYAITDK